MERHIIPAPAHKTGDTVSGFSIDAITPIDDVKVLCYECTHLVTGARLVHLHCNDRDNMYSICFRTPPTDSAGEAHILEHSVLAGSEKYPLRDVFAELGKTSMATYLNAGTYPDKTVYPVSSAVHADFWNLADVYTDVTLKPLVTRNTFMQEGHHFDFETEGDIDSPLTITGVVYNEMKGAMSAPERVVYQSSLSALLPDTIYAYNSGGDPERIPELTYEGLVDFHRKHYNPTNGTWFLYGDIPLAEHLAFVAARLQGFKKVAVDTSVGEQAVWTKPRRSDSEYPVAADESLTGKTYVTVAWMVAHQRDVEETLLLKVLGEALLGNAAGPLRKAVIDSGLGQDLLSGGYSGHQQQASFDLSLRGSEADRAEKVETLVLDTLRALADRGLEADLVEAAFHKLEFSGREIQNSFAPDQLLDRMAELSNYGIDPKNGLLYGSLIGAARERWLREKDLFPKLIRRWLLDNPHRLLCVVKPSATMASEKEAAFKTRMAALKATMSKVQLEKIRDDAAALKAAQEKPESSEAMASLPRIALSDVPRTVPVFPTVLSKGEPTVMTHPAFSNGILAVDLAFDASDLSDEEVLLIPFFAKATLGLGAAGLDYSAMATRISRASGGLDFSANGYEPLGTLAASAPKTVLVLRGSSLARNVPELFYIFRDLCLSADYSDGKRVKDLAHECFNDSKSNLTWMGSYYAYLGAAAALSPACLRNEQLNGFSQVMTLRDIVKQCDDDSSALASRLRKLADKLLARARLTVNLTGDPAMMADAEKCARAYASSLPAGTMGKAGAVRPSPVRAVGMAVQSEVNFVARVLKTVGIEHQASPAIKTLCFVASTEYMYKKLRVQGGAYGGSSRYDASQGGVLRLTSYRDPRLQDTVADFNGFCEFVRSAEFDQAALDKARIGLIGEIDYILSPKTAGNMALQDYYLGIDEARRKAFRDGLFSVTLADIKEKALPLVELAFADAPKGVIGSREAIEKANAAFAGGPHGGRTEAPFTIVSLEG